jgi:hypothetical protein
MSRGQRSFARDVVTATDAEGAASGAEVDGARGGAFGSVGAVAVGQTVGAAGEHEQHKTAKLTAVRTTLTSRD